MADSTTPKPLNGREVEPLPVISPPRTNESSSPTDPSTFRCAKSECTLTFPRREALDKHRRDCHRETWQCPGCYKTILKTSKFRHRKICRVKATTGVAVSEERQMTTLNTVIRVGSKMENVTLRVLLPKWTNVRLIKGATVETVLTSPSVPLSSQDSCLSPSLCTETPSVHSPPSPPSPLSLPSLRCVSNEYGKYPCLRVDCLRTFTRSEDRLRHMDEDHDRANVQSCPRCGDDLLQRSMKRHTARCKERLSLNVTLQRRKRLRDVTAGTLLSEGVTAQTTEESQVEMSTSMAVEEGVKRKRQPFPFSPSKVTAKIEEKDNSHRLVLVPKNRISQWLKSAVCTGQRISFWPQD